MSTTTSLWARIARVSARRRDPCVTRSSSPLQSRTAELSSKSTIAATYLSDLYLARETGRLSYTCTMANVEDVTEALRDVIDPELGLDFVELGLIYDVEVDAGTVRVTYTLTSPGCPIGPQVSEQIEEFVSELDGVDEVQPTMTFSPAWTPERMSEDAKFALGF
jgi:metal-sulfur cluster biosynthetic enzyme